MSALILFASAVAFAHPSALAHAHARPDDTWGAVIVGVCVIALYLFGGRFGAGEVTVPVPSSAERGPTS